MRASLEWSKVSNISKQGSILTKCPPMQKLSLAQRRRRITLTSRHYRGRFALRVTPISPWVAHSNYLLRQQSENEYSRSKNRSIQKFFGCFSRFSYFLHFNAIKKSFHYNFFSILRSDCSSDTSSDIGWSQTCSIS